MSSVAQAPARSDSGASSVVGLGSVLIAVFLYVAVYLALDYNKLYALRYGADLGTFLQTIVNMAHGSSWNYGEWRSHMQVHNSWILFALAPFVAIYPRAETLIAIQVFVVAIAAVPLVLFARELGVSERAANALGIAYLLTPSAQGFTYDNFSENVFVPVLAFSLALVVRRRSIWPSLAIAQLLMGVKEDEILFVGWFALVGLFWWDRRIGSAVLGLAGVNAALCWGVQLVFHSHLNTPAYSFSIEDPGGKITLALLLLAPFAFAPVVIGRWLCLGIPLLAEIVFAQRGAYEPSRIGTHYTAPLVSCAAIAAAFGVQMRHGFARWMVPCALAVMLLVFNDSGLRPGRWPFIVDWNAYARAVAIRDGKVPILLQRRDEGVWAVAAANPLIQLNPHSDPGFVACPGYNTDAAAFFASIGLGRRRPAPLCGGVPRAEVH
jgi:uncharacterized membrane protein